VLFGLGQFLLVGEACVSLARVWLRHQCTCSGPYQCASSSRCVHGSLLIHTRHGAREFTDESVAAYIRRHVSPYKGTVGTNTAWTGLDIVVYVPRRFLISRTAAQELHFVLMSPSRLSSEHERLFLTIITRLHNFPTSRPNPFFWTTACRFAKALTTPSPLCLPSCLQHSRSSSTTSKTDFDTQPATPTKPRTRWPLP